MFIYTIFHVLKLAVALAWKAARLLVFITDFNTVKYMTLISPDWHNVHTTFNEEWWNIPKVKWLDVQWFYVILQPTSSLGKKMNKNQTKLVYKTYDIKNAFQWIFFEYRKETPTSDNSLSNISFLKNVDVPDVLTEVACTPAQVEGPGNSNSFLDLKTTLDSRLYHALVECIHHHQQTLQ